MNKLSDSNHPSTRLPLSIKGVLIHEGQVLLLKNERDEWELPGGKLEPGEAPLTCVTREIWEETGLASQVEFPLTPYLYDIAGAGSVLIIPFSCRASNFENLALSHEHKEIGVFPLADLGKIKLPIGYRKVIQEAVTVKRSKLRA
ncbi:NUDIX hydrolase [Pseudomonas nicosulfuronedens]